MKRNSVYFTVYFTVIYFYKEYSRDIGYVSQV